MSKPGYRPDLRRWFHADITHQLRSVGAFYWIIIMDLYTPKSLLALCSVIAVAHFYSFTALAAESIEKITITGSRVPTQLQNVSGSVSVIGGDEIQLSAANQLADILRGLPGVAISTSGSSGALTEIRLRGNESNHLLVILDGIVINDDSQGGLIDLAHIRTDEIKRIELHRGPQAAAWGSGAVGGVLHIETYTPRTDTSDLFASIAVGNKNTQHASARISSQYLGHRYRVSAQHMQTEGDNIARSGPEKDGYKRNAVNAYYAYTVSDIEADVSANFASLTNEYDGIDYLVSGLPVDATHFTDAQKASAKASITYSPHQTNYATSLTTTLSAHENHNYEFGEFFSAAESERFQLTNTHSINWEHLSAVVGAEYVQRWYRQRGMVSFADPNQNQDDQTSSVFFESKASLSAAVEYTLGARFDRNSEFEHAVSYRNGLSWRITPNYTTFVSLGKAIKNPSFTERFGYFPGTFLGNPDLQPEHIQEWEWGIRARYSSSLRAQVSIYESDFEDEILGFVFDPSSGLMTAENAETKSERRGLDSEFTWDWGTLQWRGAYSYLEATEQTNTLNQAELRRPRHSGSLTLAGTFTDKLAAYLKWSYTGSQVDAFFPPPMFASHTVLLRPYSLLSFTISYDLTPAWKTSFRVQNALDHEFEDIVGFTGESRSVLFTLTYADNN
ncbi:TonB-dependent receptor [Alteromonas ponticola]|uniref:TonB-dependent receptor n=1 Tax=Alteromonas aquimaris TaxID=2998417 RepID=A0ABT3P9F3_9ALTE|nr:TonB-dependent receptor [Alteromonas aquimaris]MCW8109383.1 TonB-dependent receptor [Alteromonas aquimaris]